MAIGDRGSGDENGDAVAIDENYFQLLAANFFVVAESAGQRLCSQGQHLAGLFEPPAASDGIGAGEIGFEGLADHGGAGGVHADIVVVGIGDHHADGKGAENGFEATTLVFGLFE